MTRLLGGEVPTEEGEAARTSRERVVVVPGHFDGLRRMRVLEVVQGPELDCGRRAHRRRRPRARRRCKSRVLAFVTLDFT